jgi:hypothetical protein
MLLPFTSLQKMAMAARQSRSGLLCEANSVPEVIEKSLPQSLSRQRQRGAPFGRRQS